MDPTPWETFRELLLPCMKAILASSYQCGRIQDLAVAPVLLDDDRWGAKLRLVLVVDQENVAHVRRGEAVVTLSHGDRDVVAACVVLLADALQER